MTFFRECEAFEKIAKGIIPELFKNQDAGETIRMWISGCATGEEAYSFAILLLKASARHRLRPAIQVFGSDLDSIFYAGQVETDRQLAEWANTASLPSRLASA